MTVYIDTARNKFGRMIMCHMIADTPSELHKMAAAIGLQRQWYQSPDKASFPHYDLSLSQRYNAVFNGAVVLTRRELVRVMRHKKRQLLAQKQTWKSAGWL